MTMGRRLPIYSVPASVGLSESSNMFEKEVASRKLEGTPAITEYLPTIRHTYKL